MIESQMNAQSTGTCLSRYGDCDRPKIALNGIRSNRPAFWFQADTCNFCNPKLVTKPK